MTVTIAYTLQPTEKLPEGLKTVAVNEAEVEATEAGTEDADRAKKWSRMAADMIESMIIDANKAHQSPVTVAKRRETKNVMAEHDMAAAGLTQGSSNANAGAPPQLVDVQGLIKSKLNIRNEVKSGKQRTVSAASIAAFAGHGWGGGGGSIDTEEVESVSRNLTVQCSFSMYDKGGNALFQFSPDPFRKLDKSKPSPVFGSSKTEANLDSADAIIGELVEQGTREFVSMFVPVQMKYTYELESSSNEKSAEGVQKMRGRFYDEAIGCFREAVAKEGSDYRTLFCLGVAYELTGKYDDAIQAYRQAASSKGVDAKEAAMYQGAADRLNRHKSRIIKEGK
jgi:tetratricopeptide (TPR) repeat protein